MSQTNPQITALLEAIKISPENIPLRKMLAELYFSEGQFKEAEDHLKEALKYLPESVDIKILLARAFFELDKKSAANVVVEELLHKGVKSGALYMLSSRLHFENENIRDYVFIGYICVYEIDVEQDIIIVFGFIKYKDFL